jgi:hypothetical protein
MKTTSVKFTRNPQFTPASLSVRELARIEWAVKALFERSYRDGEGGKNWGFPLLSGKEAAASMTSKWFSPAWASDPDGGCNCQEVPARKARHDHAWAWLANNPNGMKYFSSCWNYLMAIAKHNGEVTEPTIHSRAYYAERINGYN